MENQINNAFKEIRKKLGFKQSSFVELGISKSSISRFERGETSLPVHQFYQALEFMDITFYEFNQTYLSYRNSEFKEMYDEIYDAYYSRDVLKIKKIMYKIKSPLLKIALKSLIYDFERGGKLTYLEREKLVDFIFSIETWGIFEFSILQFSIGQIDEKRIVKILKLMKEETSQFTSIRQYRRYIVQIFLKGIFILILLGDKNDSENFLKDIQKMTENDDLFLKNCILFMEGYYEYKFFNIELGRKKINECINIFDTLDCQDMSNFFKYLSSTI
ncbi:MULTISPECIES: Rgg/GadR/MutR family transcriptional regulator [unclassified Lactococcus]|uniref:Rgg/GadR/MutR family transcriptional regulator n=1 Tax=unclassified Lactococcus TaxID=2643510 RepID=UPI0011C7A393|nr:MULTISPECIES: Rgg/GadR/MutR family transcriptional regulator [unclassified Lactococcus]MQW22865.1 helix-turn-helix domain-containing protein [Lactococcus sp. dk101]TXK44588.1 helix-turn-helix domain-containing protein [Lactococcus sp. dk310]TXK50441.1 helix-turn-helix domain-containing protein [Lactococcus sp. dk322]